MNVVERYAAGERDFAGAHLRDAYLRNAYLGGADLRGADLRGANLRDAYLGGAYLRGADLRGAYLRGANLRGANLGGANLGGAHVANVLWPAPTMVLLASWVQVSDELCVDLMRYDAVNHPEGEEAFDRWVETGTCPYDDVTVERCVHFLESRSLWRTYRSDVARYGPVPSALELARRLLAEGCAGATL